MKVLKLWECECGGTKIVTPPHSNRIIIKGDAWHENEPISHASRIITRCCADKYTVLPPTIEANELKRLWICGCGLSKAAQSKEKGTIVLQGKAFAYGSPTTHAKCSECLDRFRIAPDVEWASHIAQKQGKRANSKKNRRARKRRQKLF